MRSVNGFNFKYGRVEVRAQLPQGDWLWPAIWMLPTNNEFGSWPASGEIDIVESYGQASDGTCSYSNSQFGSTLHFGPSWQYDPYDLAHGDYTHTESLANDFHTYGLYWNEEGIRTYIDDESNVVLDFEFDKSMWEKGGFSDDLDNPWRFETDYSAPFNKKFYLIMNVAVGGTNGYFPDGECSKPWSDTSSTSGNDFWNAKDSWYPSWNYPTSNDAALKIDSVKVWSFDDEDIAAKKKSVKK